MVKNREGCFSISPRASSCHTRSATSASTSPLSTILRINDKRLRREGETEARGEPRAAQDAHRIFGECVAHMAQNAGLQICLSAMGIDQVSLRILRNGIDGEIAPQQILFQCDLR